MTGKKLFKKGIALTCTGVMLASSATVFAATGVTGGGDSAVENDNSTAPTYFHVALPTITANTYDFKIDTEGLLSQYGDSTKYDGASNVYFSAVKTGNEATAAATTAGEKLYTLEKVEDTGAAAIIAELTTMNTTSLPAAFAKKYYVWQPDRSSADTIAAGAGVWTEVTPANVDKFMTLTEDASNAITAAALRTDFKYGADIWDGKIYEEKYVELTDTKKAAKYFTVDDTGAITAVAAGLYVGDGTAANTVAVDTANAATKITYTPAEFININTSQPATVTNQSSSPVVVTADISLPFDNGLTFQNTTTFTGVADAALCLQINDGTNDTAVETANGKTGATAYYLLQGANETPIKYQGTDFDTATGSHNYYQYVPVPSGAVYASVDFTLKGAANAEADAKDAWAAYIADLRNGTAHKPDITVVYDFDKVELDANDAAKLTYVGESGANYTITTAGASEKATLATPPTPPTPGYFEYVDGANAFYCLGPVAGDGNTPFADTATVSSVKINNVDVTYTMVDGWLQVTWADIEAVGQGSTASTWVFTYVVDGTTYTVTST